MPASERRWRFFAIGPMETAVDHVAELQQGLLLHDVLNPQVVQQLGFRGRCRQTIERVVQGNGIVQMDEMQEEFDWNIFTVRSRVNDVNLILRNGNIPIKIVVDQKVVYAQPYEIRS